MNTRIRLARLALNLIPVALGQSRDWQTATRRELQGRDLLGDAARY